MNLNFIFKSYDHLRYENGRHVSGPHGGANRAVKVEPNISGGEDYTVTVYNLDGNHPVWQNNVQMSPKQMKVIQRKNDKIVLRGFGRDMLGASFADYGLTIHIKHETVEKCILHMYDRNVDIEYLKSQEQSMPAMQPDKDDFDVFVDFIHKWNNEMPRDLKYSIAKKTDELNNIGVDFYEEGDIENAINFYNQALSVMPSNDDALKNLEVCYTKTNNIVKLLEVRKKLDYLNRLGL